MPTLSISLQVTYPGAEFHASRTDGRFRLYDRDGVLVADLTVGTITASVVGPDSLFTFTVSEIPEAYRPGYGLFDFTDDAEIQSVVVDSVALTTLLRTALSAIPEGLPQIEDVRLLLEDAGLTPPADYPINQALLSAIDTVAATLGRSFDLVTEARLLDGSGTEWLLLPRPASAVTAIERVDPAGAVSEAYPSSAWLAYPLESGDKTRICRRAACWPQGRGNVRVNATWGEAPDRAVYWAMAKLAALDLAGAAIDLARGAMGIVKWSQTDMSEQYGTGDPATLAGWRSDVERVLAGRSSVSAWFA